MATKTQIQKLTESIEKLLANPVAPVLPIAPVAPIAPIAPIVQVNSGDHDLLTKLDTKVDQIQIDVSTLKNQGLVYVTQTEHAEVCKEQADHETRLRVTESFINTLMGKIWGIGILAGAVTGLLSIAITHFWK